MRGDTAHQKLATLSSKRPRWTGKMRRKTCVASSSEPRNGSQHSAIVATTVAPRDTSLPRARPHVGWSTRHLPSRKKKNAGA